MQSHLAIPVLRTILNDEMDLYLALKKEDLVIARHYANKISADMKRILEFLEKGA